MAHVRRWIGGLAGALTAPLLVACDPPPPPTTFTVTTTVDGADLVPGDGTCEITAGTGDCSLRAALAEADALGGTGAPGGVVVSVPAGTYTLGAPTTLTATDVQVVGAGVDGTSVNTAAIEVASGSSLRLTDLSAFRTDGGASVPGISVHGSLALERARVASGTVIVTVQPGGLLFARNSTVRGGLTTPVVSNAGTAVMDHVTLESIGSTTALLTSGAGSSFLRSTALTSPGSRFPPGTGDACGGTQPVSLGYNTAWGTSCVLDGPGDQVGVNPYDAATRAPLIDKIGVGVNGCGDPDDVDVHGTVRPLDGDGVDGPACDIGATEHAAP